MFRQSVGLDNRRSSQRRHLVWVMRDRDVLHNFAYRTNRGATGHSWVPRKTEVIPVKAGIQQLQVIEVEGTG